ncbi:MAG: cytoplasmic protein, partial [Deltaproteobacteria bacterium]|nr:cytoplasmic protein [Deltaproteobacteria bacterium]
MDESRIDFTVDKTNLYMEESITDLKTASIRCLTPVKADGTPDESRQKIYVGHTQLMSPQGPIPLQARLNAATLTEAIDRFPAAMQNEMARVIEEVKKMQQEMEKEEQRQKSNLILPR